jgi:pyruvate/2-oxoglutarate dehydrogenase complex dihydrolipoamide dehydrogenase (E3) component
LRNEDADVSDALMEILKSEGIDFRTSTTTKSVTVTSGDSVTLTGVQHEKPFEITAVMSLSQVAAYPHTADAGLKAAGV